MPFEKGNKLGAANAGTTQKGRLFDGALKRAIAQSNGEKLRRAAEQLLDHAANGEPWAIAQLADRLDGKASQHMTVETKDVTDLSLGELVAEMAAARSGGADPASGSDEARELH